MAVKVNELKQKVLDCRAALNALLEQQSGAKGKIAGLLQEQLQAGTTDAADSRAAVATAQAAAKVVDDKVSTHRLLVSTFEEQLFAEEQRLAIEDAVLVRSGTRVEAGAPNSDKDPRRGFRSHQEFFAAVMANSGMRNRDQVQDELLRPLAVMDKKDEASGGELAFVLPRAFTPPSILATAGSDELGEYDDRYGGFSVVTTRLAPRPLIGFEGDPTIGRTDQFPMGSPSVEIEAATDKTHTSSVSAGFTVARKAETVAATASRDERELIAFKASSLFGLAYATEEILADSPQSFLARINSGFAMQFAAHMLAEKLRGKGGNEYLGILTALAASSLGPTVSVAKEAGQVADTIVAANVIKMRSRCWGYGSAIWLANHDTFPQLATMSIGVGAAGVLVYQQSVVEDRPDMLLGRPIFYSEFAATLGDQGDIILGNWSQYGEGLLQPMQSAESAHVRFLNHERAIKFWVRNAGQPYWRVALTPNKSSATLSPFVVLDAR